MTSFRFRALKAFAAAAVLMAGIAAASGQSGNQSNPSPPGFLNGLFGGGDNGQPAGRDRQQGSAAELTVRIDRLEGQIRQLTGAIEQLQYRNQQLAEQLRRLQEDSDYRFQELGSKGGASPPAGVARAGVPVIPAAPAPPDRPQAAPPPAAAPGRRGDAFDPTQNPGAPGAPRTLGSIAVPGAEEPLAPAPGGRVTGEPLNLSTLSANAAAEGAPPGGGAPPRYPAEGGAQGGYQAGSQIGSQVATLPPSDSPKDNFDLAYGYVLHKDYALAEDGFRSFLRKFPSDRLSPDAEYWLGESMFQRQHYHDAAEAFLNVSTKYETTAKAPDSLLRLGQSLAALGEKEAACASLGEVLRKYPRAALSIKQGVDREQKRVGC
jgi:tol-pal system protein YbgF